MADTGHEPLLPAIPETSEDENTRPVAPVTVSADGYLKKRNRWGFYQKRFFVLNGVEFTYYSNAHKKNPRPPLRVSGAALNGRFGDFEVEAEMKDGTTRDLDLRANGVKDAELWVEKIEEAEAAAEKAAENDQRIVAVAKKPVPRVLREMEGYLEMPSGIRFKPWQDRYFRLKNSSMLYYHDNSKSVNDYEGEIVLADPTASHQKTIVELTDSANGRGFVVRTGVRDYKFKAPTADAAKDWVSVLQERVDAIGVTGTARSTSEEKSDLPVPNQTPKWIEEWDAESESDHIIRIQQHLDNLFPPKNDPEYRKRTLNAVTVLLEELDDKARECMPVDGVRRGLTLARRESRPDIFERIIRFFHIRIVDELSQFVMDQSYENLSVRELLRFMDLITAYDTKIKEILQGEVGEQILEGLPPFGLLDNADNMAVRYSKVCETQISAWVENVIFETCLQGEARVFIRLDGRYQTPGPTDIFNLLDQALQLGKVSGVKRLQSEIVSMSAVSMGLYAVSVTQDLVKKKNDSLPYACAIANDCWSVIEHVAKLESEHKNDAYKVDFEPVREKCAVGADKCLEALSAMVISDLRQTLEQLFTKEHLESVVDSDDAIAVVCATMDDYLEDFQVLLELQFVIRVSRMLVRDIVGYYLARLAHVYNVDRKVALTKREVDLVKLDRKRFVACLQGRFPTLDIVRIFSNELAPFDDVLDMLSSAPALIPQTAVKIAQRDSFFGPHLRSHIMNTAKMCVDLSCNGQGGNDRMVKEIKALVVTELEEKIATPSTAPLSEDKYELFERLAFVRMWPQVKKPSVKRAGEGTEKVNIKQVLKEETKITVVDIGEETRAKPSTMQKQVSRQWRPMNKDGESKVQPAEINGPPTNILTPLYNGLLKFRDAKAKEHIQYFCSIRPISETHTTDYEFVVFKGTSSANPPAFRVRISDVAKVAFWEELGPKHFGPDGKVVEDVPFGMGKNALEFGVAKNASEFSISTKAGEKAHFIADTSQTAMEWIKQLRKTVEESFEKWGVSFVEGQQEYMKMSIKQLKELGRQRGLDMKGCMDNLDMIRVLKNGAPLLNQPAATPQKPASDNAPKTPAITATTVSKTQNESPAAMDPGLSINASMFSKKESNLNVQSAAAAASVPPASSAKPVAAAAAVGGAAVIAGATAAVDQPGSKSPAKKPSEQVLPTKKETAPLLAAASSKPQPQPIPQTSTNGTTSSYVQAAPSTASATPVAPPKPVAAPTTATAATASSVTRPAAAVATPVQKPVAAAAPVAAPLASGSINAQEQQLLEVQSMIVNGHMLLEEGDPAQASRLFKKAKELAETLQSVQLKAKANAGLAASYRDQDTMRRASGPHFELAARLFAISGDTSDRINCIEEAADVYLRQGMKAEALKVLEQYVRSAANSGQPTIFEDRIQKIKATMAS